MAASQPRRKLFDFPITSGSSPFSIFLTYVIYLAFWITLFLGALLLLTISPQPVSGEVFLEPELLKESHVISSRVPREIIRLDADDDHYNGYNNPTVLEAGGSAANGRSAGGGDAFETLRQLSLASTQPFIKRRLFNTSVALTVPLFSFTLPQRAAEGSTVDLANQAIFGLFALLTVMLVFTVPVLFTGIRPFDVYGRSMKEESSQDILNNLLKTTDSAHTINLMGTDLQNRIGLNPEECLKKTICDAHRHPKKYGLFALPFHIFYPAPAPGSSEAKSMSGYQRAAQSGEYTKEAECFEMYNCFFDVLDLAVYFRDWFTPFEEENDTDTSNFDKI